MALLWLPDTCVDGSCLLEVEQGHKALVEVKALCSHHEKIRAGLKSDDALFDAIIETNRVKNYAAYEVAKIIGVETAEVAWSIDETDRVVFKAIDAEKQLEVSDAIIARVGADKAIVE